ncbi:hypothetical protein [Virgibacillus necropolis]|uniref:Uncharacterized protein n=1 Tax=Virgibacillus necropolis TaxID=163877 RepID=A0A221MEK5_9BACI|nr:hypothetical protein [Virgibacillus necropolis]ASN06108.1 hypothetical protein CFK40_14310 [Virgibacillus necropolis]
MDRIVQLLNGSIDELDKLEEEIRQINEDEFDQLSSSYPFNEYFHEVVSGLKKWKNDIENT